MKKYSNWINSWAIGLMAFLIPISPLISAWNPIVNVSAPNDSFSIGGPVLDVNNLNNGIAVWATPEVENLVKASFYTFGLGWSAPIVISSTALNQFGKPIYVNQGDPTVAMNDSNYAVAIWEGSEFLIEPEINIEGLFAVTRSSDGTWSSVERITPALEETLDYNPENPFVDVNNAGLAVAVWTELRDGERYIMTSFLPLGGSWTTPFELANPFNGNREDTPYVQINSSNNAIATWKAQSETGDLIGAATYNALTNTWTTVTLDDGATYVSLPRAGIDENGNGIVVWMRDIDGVTQIVSASYNFATQSFGPNVIVSTPPGGVAADGTTVVMDQFGNATAVWTQILTEAPFFQVYASRLPLGGTWSTPILISTNPELDGNSLDAFMAQTTISVDNLGNVIVIYSTGAETDNLYSVTYYMGIGWTAPELIGTVNSNIWHNINYGICGFAIALWNAEEQVQAADNFGLFPPPTNLLGLRCCQRFVSQTCCINSLEWTPSPSCISFYRIYRNGVLIATIPATESEFQDPICRRNGAVTYTLTAVNVFGLESLPSFVTIP